MTGNRKREDLKELLKSHTPLDTWLILWRELFVELLEELSLEQVKALQLVWEGVSLPSVPNQLAGHLTRKVGKHTETCPRRASVHKTLDLLDRLDPPARQARKDLRERKERRVTKAIPTGLDQHESGSRTPGVDGSYKSSGNFSSITSFLDTLEDRDPTELKLGVNDTPT